MYMHWGQNISCPEEVLGKKPAKNHTALNFEVAPLGSLKSSEALRHASKCKCWALLTPKHVLLSLCEPAVQQGVWVSPSHDLFQDQRLAQKTCDFYTESFHRLNCIYMLMKIHRYGEPPTTKQKIWVKVIRNKIRKGKKGSKLDRAKLDPAPVTKTWWKPNLKGSLSELLPQYPRAISPETQKSSVLSKARLGRG